MRGMVSSCLLCLTLKLRHAVLASRDKQKRCNHRRCLWRLVRPRAVSQTNQLTRSACAPECKLKPKALNQKAHQTSGGIARLTRNVNPAEAAMPPTRASDVANRQLHFTAASVSGSFKRIVLSVLHSENNNLLNCLTLKISNAVLASKD
jgi:hypothetical protein